MLNGPPAASSVLALVTTFHLGLAALRNHRTASTLPLSSLAVISLLLAALPWLFQSPVGLGLGVLVHLAWFGACEWLAATPHAHSSSTVQLSNATAARHTRHTSADPAIATSPRVSSDRPTTGVERPRGFVQVPVLAVHEETPTVRTFRFSRPDGFDFEAGQFVTVRVRVDGKEYARCYSISSAPDICGYLEISVKRQGLVSNALHASARPGSSLSVKAPAGAFKYPGGDDRPLLLLAGGIGITPLISMLRHAAAREPTRPVTLLYAARTEAEFAFRDELLVTARRHPQVRVYFAMSQGVPPHDIYPGHLDEALLRTTMPDLHHSISLICGPPPMIEGMRATLTRLGVPSPQIRFEVFQAAVAASAGLAAGAPAAALPRRRASAHHIECARTKQRVPVAPGQTLLEAAEAGGVEIPSLCRAGVCGTCRIRVTEGDAHCDSTVLDGDEVEQGFVLACVTTVQSDCVVDV
jgi:ferredoxin-NADP reductase